jgi:hypothetical protein
VRFGFGSLQYYMSTKRSRKSSTAGALFYFLDDYTKKEYKMSVLIEAISMDATDGQHIFR